MKAPALDPIRTTENLRDAYLRYLETTFRLNQPGLHEQFHAQLKEPGKLVRGPLLEATSPYQPGANLDRRGDKDLGGDVGRDHGADVAAVQYRAAAEYSPRSNAESPRRSAAFTPTGVTK